jgi:hypothetical protein
MPTTIIAISPSAARPGLFEARCDGRLLCVSSTPHLAGARELIKLGYSPAAILVTRRGSVDCLRSTVGAAARLTVAEDDRDPPRFRAWKAPQSREGSPPIARSNRPATSPSLTSAGTLQPRPPESGGIHPTIGSVSL